MSERRRYRNPPIREALCEFQFRPGKDWDPTIPGYLHAAVQTSYNGRRGEQRTLETKIEAGGPDAPNIIQTQGPSKAQFFTNDETRMLAVGPNVLSVHMLAPYQASADLEASGWEEFQLRIEEALKKYWELANPLGVHRIGIRYVNNIRVRAKSISILDYLAAGPLEVQGLPDQMVGFVSRTEYRYEDNILLVVSQGTVPAPVVDGVKARLFAAAGKERYETVPS